MVIESLLEKLKLEWSEPKFNAVGAPYNLALTAICRFSDRPASVAQMQQISGRIPDDLKEFWQIAQWAELFKDEAYGQWGLHVLSPLEALNESSAQRKRRPDQRRKGDLIIGRFFGDLDLLLVRLDEKAPDYNAVLVADSIYSRGDWPTVASSFEEFLTLYVVAEGEKYWEEHLIR
jgi:hypothetical protein